MVKTLNSDFLDREDTLIVDLGVSSTTLWLNTDLFPHGSIWDPLSRGTHFVPDSRSDPCWIFSHHVNAKPIRTNFVSVPNGSVQANPCQIDLIHIEPNHTDLA